MKDEDKPKKRGPKEERLNIEEDPETALDKLLRKDAKRAEGLRQTAALLREKAANARENGSEAVAKKLEDKIARMEHEAEQLD